MQHFISKDFLIEQVLIGDEIELNGITFIERVQQDTWHRWVQDSYDILNTDQVELFIKSKIEELPVVHLLEKGFDITDVLVGELIDFEAGCFCQRQEYHWIQWDGGMGVHCSNEEVSKWVEERTS